MIWRIFLVSLLVGIFYAFYPTFSFAAYTNPQSCQTNVPCFGDKQYIEYIKGDLPLVISAPHGGYLTPVEIPNRSCSGCVTGRDTGSQEYAREVREEIHRITGKYPHVILNKLARVKLDANREIVEAAQGSPIAERAWYEYHEFIEYAKMEVEIQCGRGHYFDFHTNGHTSDKWVEMGNLLSASSLAQSDTQLNSGQLKNSSSLRSLANQPGVLFSTILRGPDSMGTVLMGKGYKSVPSMIHPDPAGGGYFNGGYNTSRHGSRSGGTIDGTQVETYYGFISTLNRAAYSSALASTIISFVESHYDFHLGSANICSVIPSASATPMVSLVPNTTQTPTPIMTLTPIATQPPIYTPTPVLTATPTPIIYDVRFMGIKLGEFKETQNKFETLRVILKIIGVFN